MRLWSLHPKYLDTKGLTACWREGLLAQAVLFGETKGYKNHPQLKRFKNMAFSSRFVTAYLREIYYEAVGRGHKFNFHRIDYPFADGFQTMTVTSGQIKFEANHLRKKLIDRAHGSPQYELLIHDTAHKQIEPHPLFRIVPGKIEQWEKLK